MKKNNNWFSVILAILMTWFMLVLTAGVFLLILWENKDTKELEYYFKSQAWAEWWLEIAMLKAKNNNYSHSEKNNDPNLLCKDKDNCNHKDTIIDYKIVSTWTWVINKFLESYEFAIIPLFSKDNSWSIINAKDIELSWIDWDLVWNIIWKDSWITWTWSFDVWKYWNFRRLVWWNADYEKTKIWDFLNTSIENYLILHNTSNSWVYYNVESKDWKEITLDNTYILSSWEIMWFKQNIQTFINTSEYLNLLKYSVYSPD